MSILWCGGEDIDFPNGASTGYSNGTTNIRRTDYSRLALKGAGGMSKSTTFSAVTSCWLSVIASMYARTYNNQYYVGLGKSGTNKGLFLGIGATDSKLSLMKYDGTTVTVLDTDSDFTLLNTDYKLDMHVSSYGASATVKVYRDGVEVISYTGDVSVTGVTNLDSVFFYGTSVDIWYLSEFIVADEDTRLMSLKTLAPNSGGDANSWAGAYTDVDEITYSDVDVLNTDTNNNETQMNLTGMPTGSYDIEAVKLVARASKTSDATPAKCALGIKSGGTIDNDSGHSLTSEQYNTYERLMATNPVTSSAFTSGEIDALQYNLKALA